MNQTNISLVVLRKNSSNDVEHGLLGLGAELIAKQHRGDMHVTYSDAVEVEGIKTPDDEENVIESEQLTPTTPSALQLQLGMRHMSVSTNSKWVNKG